jgi:hypothetical protein
LAYFDTGWVFNAVEELDVRTVNLAGAVTNPACASIDFACRPASSTQSAFKTFGSSYFATNLPIKWQIS